MRRKVFASLAIASIGFLIGCGGGSGSSGSDIASKYKKQQEQSIKDRERCEFATNNPTHVGAYAYYVVDSGFIRNYEGSTNYDNCEFKVFNKPYTFPQDKYGLKVKEMTYALEGTDLVIYSRYIDVESGSSDIRRMVIKCVRNC